MEKRIQELEKRVAVLEQEKAAQEAATSEQLAKLRHYRETLEKNASEDRYNIPHDTIKVFVPSSLGE